MRSALAEDTVPNLENPPSSRPIAPTARPVIGRIAPAPARPAGPRAQVSRPQPKPELERAMTTFSHGAVRPQPPLPATARASTREADASGPQPIQARTSTPPALPARPSAPPLPAARTSAPPIRTSAPPAPRTSAPPLPARTSAIPAPRTSYVAPKPPSAATNDSPAVRNPSETPTNAPGALASATAPKSPEVLAKTLDRAAGPKPWYVTGERPRARTAPIVAPALHAPHAPLGSHAPLVPSLDEARPSLEPARPSHVAPRAVRPLPVGGPPPTVIRDLDALFSRESRKSSAPRAAQPAAPAQPPIDPARFAQMLLQKVESDFTPARASYTAPAPAAPVPAQVAPVAAFAAAPAARVVAFVPSPVGAHAMERTAELALPADDEDVAQLVPWYRRLWTKLFAR